MLQQRVELISDKTPFDANDCVGLILLMKPLYSETPRVLIGQPNAWSDQPYWSEAVQGQTSPGKPDAQGQDTSASIQIEEHLQFHQLTIFKNNHMYLKYSNVRERENLRKRMWEEASTDKNEQQK